MKNVEAQLGLGKGIEMTDFDVERVVEFEIEQLKEGIATADHIDDIIEMYESLVDALELRIAQLEQKLSDLDSVT